MRSISAAIRDELEASQTGDFPVVFADLSHPDITTIRVNSDNQDYLLSSVLYYGWSFDLSLPSDGDDPSKAKVTIQNVDSELGEMVLSISSPLSLVLRVFLRSDFTTANPAVGSPTPSMWWRRAMKLTNIQVSESVISADVSGDDLTTEPWPFHRAIRAVLPGLYR